MSAALSSAQSDAHVSSRSASVGIRLVDKRDQSSGSDPHHDVLSRSCSLIAVCTYDLCCFWSVLPLSHVLAVIMQI